MAITQEMLERLQHIVTELEPHTAKLNANSQSFVADQAQRLDRYGTGSFISAKQIAWLEDLYEKHCGSVSSITTSNDGARKDLLGDDDIEERRDRDYSQNEHNDRGLDSDIPF